MGVVPNRNSIQMLKKLVPLNMLSEEDLEHLLQTASVVKAKAGAYLFRQGDTDYHNVYLISGQVALLDKMREVDRVAAGSETARFPIAHQIPRKNSVRAIGRVEYVLIDNRKLSELLVRTDDDDYKVSDLNSAITDDWMAQLLQSRVFQQIPAANIQGVIMRMEKLEVKGGERVIEQGGEGDYFYLINQGQCIVQRKDVGEDEPTELAKLGPGDSFGEEALLSNSPRNSSVRMLTKGTLLRLAKEDFIEFVKRPLARGVGYEEAVSMVNNGAVWLDVRLPEEYEIGHIRNSVSLPLATLRYQASNLAVDQPYVICCGDGQLSSTAAFILTDRGYNVSVLEGGLRSVSGDILINEDSKDAETRAKVISLHSGEEITEETAPAGLEEIDALKSKLVAANNKISELGAQFQGFRDKQQKETAQSQAERKAQKVILNSTRGRLDELRVKRGVDRKSLEQLKQDKDVLTASLDDALQNLISVNSGTSDLELKLKIEQNSSRKALNERDALQVHLDKLQQEQKRSHNQAISDVKSKLEQLRNELDESQKNNKESLIELQELRDTQKELESRLDESQKGRLESEAALVKLQNSYRHTEAELEREAAGKSSGNQSEVEILRSELTSLTSALEEADVAYDEIMERAELLSEEKECATNALAEMETNSTAAREKIEALTSELDQLRMAQGQTGAAVREPTVASEEMDTLQEELRLLQQHSAAEIDELKDALLTAKSRLEELEAVKGVEKADEESLRLEMSELRESSRNWKQRSREIESKCRSLEDAIEDRDGKIDLVALELDTLKLKYSEAESAHQQHEERLKLLIESAKQESEMVEYTDPRLDDSSRALQLDDILSGSSSKGSMFRWFLLGAMVSFAALDGMLMLVGRGELVTTLLQDKAVVEVESGGMDSGVVGDVSPAGVGVEKVLTTHLAAGSDFDSIPDKTAQTAEKIGKPESQWSILADTDFGPTMVRLEGGSYSMGSNRNQVSGNEWPAHTIEVHAFAISQREVTFDEYDRFAQATGRRLPGDEGWGRGKRPVINVSWGDAVAYTEWLAGRTGKKYRLPTEAEWEFAVRGGSDSIYWWGYQVDDVRANCFDCGSQWDRRSTAPVGSFAPNNFSLHDMAGNVREWVQDCYHPNYNGAPADGSAWLDSGCKERVVRGGAYNKTSDSMRSSWRGRFKQESRLSVTGFRVVRELH